jgi:hypothetical protein
MSKLYAPKRHKREVNAYKLLSDQGTHAVNTIFLATYTISSMCARWRVDDDAGVTPQLLGHWKDETTERLVIELEYQPSIQEYPTTMRELRQYMVGTLKVPLSGPGGL